MKDLGEITNVEVIQRFVSLEGKFVIDAGCGGMTFTRHLLDLGANVLAIDPDPVQAELNRAMDPVERLQFIEASAESFPVESDSVDGVFFSYSLHHVPAEIYSTMFAEIRRVLKADGFLYVIEPLDCPWNQVMKLFHDEDEVRAAAFQALKDLAEPSFERVEYVKYHGYAQYESFEQFADHFASRSFNTIYTDEDVRNEKVQREFEKQSSDDYRFQSPKYVAFMQGIRAS